jgi:hypothetical protein
MNNSLFQSVEYVGALLKNVVVGNAANKNFQGKKLGDLRASSTTTHLQQLTGKWFLGTDRPMAKVGATTFTYTAAAGTLFGNSGPAYSDVRQGYVGDCWLVGAFAELAHQSPSEIQSMFIVNGDGTYTARFFNNGRAEYVTVDSQLPVDRNGRFVFANLGDRADNAGNVLWVALAEKAYVQMSEAGWLRGRNAINSYAVISGGLMSDALTQITGRTGFSMWMPNSATAAFDTLRTAYDSGKCVGLATGNSVANSLLVPRHQFVMVGYDAEARSITVFNPWGVNNGSSKPGLVTMNQDEVFANFIYWSRSA